MIILLLEWTASAQTFTGRIIGRVIDSQQAAIVGASVTLRSVERDFERQTITNSQGEYTFELMPPGEFKLTAEHSGFTPKSIEVEVTVALSVRADMTLKIGPAEERLEVFGGSSVAIQTDNANIDGVISDHQISELPSIGRSLYDFIALLPGATLSNDAIGVGYAVNGGRTQSANYLVDGAEDNEIIMSAPAMDVPLDSIQEFNIQTNHFSAEYGRNSGFIANIVTKSGTNRLHGSLYDYVRNSAFAANTFDNNAHALRRPVFNRHQFGGTAGGRVFRSKLFFFISTEAVRVRSSGPTSFYVPTPQLLAMSAPATVAIFDRFPVPANISSFNVKGRVVCPFGASCNPQTGTGFVSVPAFAFTSRIGPQDFGAGAPQNTILGTGRLDWSAGATTQAFVRYAIEEKDEFALALQPYSSKLDQPIYGHNQNVAINVTRTWSAKMVTESRIAYARVTGDPERLGGDGYPVPQPLFPSFSIVNENVSLPGGTPSAFGPTNTYQIFQTATYSHGNHILRFGGQFTHSRQNITFGLAGEVANAEFADTQDFVDGLLQTFAIAINPNGKFPGQYVDPPFTPPNFRRHYHYNEPGLFVEDSWKLTPRLTLTPGLRWEYFGVFHTPGPEHNLDSNFYLGEGVSFPERVANGQTLRTIDAPGTLRGRFYLPSYRNFAPRMGLAYDVFGDGKSVLRAGGGLFYDRRVGWELFRAYQNPPTYSFSSLSDITLTPAILTDQYAALPQVPLQLSKSGIAAPDSRLKSAYTASWNASFEREIGRMIAGVSYLGSGGSKLYSMNNVNRMGSAGLLDPSCITTRTAADGVSSIGPDYTNCSRLYPNATNVVLRRNEGHSSYHALQIRLDGRRWSGVGLQLGTNYTWSHSIDNRSVSGLSLSVADRGRGYLDAFDPSLDRGSSDFDARHRIGGHFIWELPIARNSRKWPVTSFLRGWEASGFFSYQTGQPFGLSDFGTPDGVGEEVTRPRLTGILPHAGRLMADLASPNTYLYLPVNQVYDPVSGRCIATASPFACEISTNGPFEGTLSRNVFRLPGLFFLNTALLKNFDLSAERLRLQLRFEFYNLLNHPNLYVNASSTDVSTSSFENGNGSFGPGVTASFRDNRQVVIAAKFLF